MLQCFVTRLTSQTLQSSLQRPTNFLELFVLHLNRRTFFIFVEIGRLENPSVTSYWNSLPFIWKMQQQRQSRTEVRQSSWQLFKVDQRMTKNTVNMLLLSGSNKLFSSNGAAGASAINFQHMFPSSQSSDKDYLRLSPTFNLFVRWTSDDEAWNKNALMMIIINDTYGNGRKWIDYQGGIWQISGQMNNHDDYAFFMLDCSI